MNINGFKLITVRTGDKVTATLYTNSEAVTFKEFPVNTPLKSFLAWAQKESKPKPKTIPL